MASRSSEERQAAEPEPRQVLSVDVDSSFDDVDLDPRYSAATVFAWRDGAPIAAADLDLSAGRAAAILWLEQLAAAPRATAPPVPASVPGISVVVPTIVERVSDLDRLVTTLRAATYPDVEVILVDNRRSVPADDALDRIRAEHPWVRIVRAARPGISAARNAGLLAASKELVAFTDDDVRVDPGWLRAIGARFARQPELAAVTGLILPAELETSAQVWFERYYGGFSGERTFAPLTVEPVPVTRRTLRGARLRVVDESGREVRRFALYGVGAYGAGANMAFRRSALLDMGGFDVALGTGTPARGGEDLAALMHVLWNGSSIGYEPSAVVHHRHRTGTDQLLRQLEGNGIGFTATLTALIRSDPRHLLGIGSQVPVALRAFATQLVGRIRTSAARPTADSPASEDAGYPRALVVAEYRAYLHGPLAYRRSRAASRRWRPE